MIKAKLCTNQEARLNPKVPDRFWAPNSLLFDGKRGLYHQEAGSVKLSIHPHLELRLPVPVVARSKA